MAAAGSNVGFLAILQDASGTLGGYLVTNSWGRPLEFRLTSAVQPSRVQAILYGASLSGFVAGELIGKTLVEKSTAPIDWLVTDSPHALELRPHVSFPVALFAPAEAGSFGRGLHLYPSFPDDGPLIERFLAESPSLDLAEPFQRVREAVAEARKLGSSQRAA